MHEYDINDLKYALDRTSQTIIGATPCPIDSAGKINPHVTRFHTEQGYLSIFHVKPIYYETPTGHWRPLYEVASFYGNHRIVLDQWWKVSTRYIAWLEKRMELIGGELVLPTNIPLRSSFQDLFAGNIGLTTTTVYPDPHAETTTVDGYVDTSSSSWATVRGATSGTANDSGVNTGAAAPRGTKFSTTFYLGRLFTLFDTSAINDTDNIDSAIYSLYFLTFSGSDTDTLDVVQTAPASNTAIVSGDIDGVTFTSGGNITYPSATVEYKDITLNATGEGWIDLTGVTKLGAITGNDLSNTEPTGFRQSSVSLADETGTSQDPKFAVTSSAGGGGGSTPTRMLLGVGT